MTDWCSNCERHTPVRSEWGYVTNCDKYRCVAWQKERTQGQRNLLLGFVVGLLLGFLLLPSDADAQTCTPPAVCATGADINAAADGLCRRARAAESRLNNEVLPDLSTCETATTTWKTRYEDLKANPPSLPERWRAPLWLTIPLKVAAVGFGAGAGACAGVGCPGEVVVGLAVASFGSIVADIVLELLERPRKPARS